MFTFASPPSSNLVYDRSFPADHTNIDHNKTSSINANNYALDHRLANNLSPLNDTNNQIPQSNSALNTANTTAANSLNNSNQNSTQNSANLSPTSSLLASL